ncbi:DNA topoisomerase IV subunit A [Polynucleobacter paneuropaeus]|uniref:DNA topoisomerase 4 subunit A n=1 Tax=Polynucleobacter paneuropaeus TaxID=2527775 RepID=A0A9Q7CW89_9BURK|nr:DNA topoisomerase IV subunit A [Polynucleobacter paneuropaeus]MBT8527311.1 DNA topoisomerase IV subunit A [Polynucleobacter paneuropaeus]MBT8533973.1 DNA topoisomerase IV subunit A [Polynucleobacter paneuropaeus]MBT8550838.1 DNA topoisomerase IV subunit A [Polynucleobacter paneuropaeus]MBT8561534.1 DNA topoisomerase IV subunit A [Polynucleobacter paneuropaeus]
MPKPSKSGGSSPPHDPNKVELNEDDKDSLTLAVYAERAYLDYAISVVKGRALPDVADGQKPVQRRILFSMSEMGLRSDAKPVKSARVVGDVLGKFHPHGDQSAYDALVRLAQSFSLRYPLIDGQGNFGSRDGDGAAAMRYTEARLTKIAGLLLSEIDEGTVDFAPNYDGSFQEPKLLPARLPFVLLNGASGIAVGMATEIPSHNLREVASAAIALMKSPKMSTTDLLEIMPGPDFPGGGQIISPANEIAQIYEGGRGSLKVRARWSVEELARGQWQIVVNELPPSTSSQKVLQEIEEITNPKVKIGKKTLTTDQNNLKSTILAVLDGVRDESSKDAAVRLVFEPKSKNVEVNEFVNLLLAHTSLESNAPINLVMIGTDGRPRQKGLKEIISEWIGFRVQTVTRRTEYRLGKVKDRMHILEGRLTVLLNIDKVIKIIRNSDEPKADLILAFKLTERQAEDILDIRLRQLARLEGIKIEQELKELKTERDDLEGLLQNDSNLRKRIIKEIESDMKDFGDDRRTIIQEDKRAVAETKVVDEPVTVIVSQKGWVRVRQGHEHDPSQFSFKAGDGMYGTFECRTVDLMQGFGSDGRVYTVPVSELPGARGDGSPLTSFVNLAAGSQMVAYYAGHADDLVLISTRAGNGFLANVSDMMTRNKAGKAFVGVDAKFPSGDAPLGAAKVSVGMKQVACLSESAKLLVFPLDELKRLPAGGKGVILMGLDGKETLASAIAVGAEGATYSGAGRAGKPTELNLDAKTLKTFVGNRARKGHFVEPRLKDGKLKAN